MNLELDFSFSLGHLQGHNQGRFKSNSINGPPFDPILEMGIGFSFGFINMN
jgi:hypothetical protein